MDSDDICPVLTLKDIVIFPHVVVPLFVGRDKSIKALDAAMQKDKRVLLVTQQHLNQDSPAFEDLHEVGVLGNILQILKMPDGNVKILVEGFQKVRIAEQVADEDFFLARFEPLEIKAPKKNVKIEAYRRSLIEFFESYSKLKHQISTDIVTVLKRFDSVDPIVDIICAHMMIDIQNKQAILEEVNLEKRCEMVLAILESEISVIHVERKIKNRVKKQMEKTQKEYYLNEQIKAIQRELGDQDDVIDEIRDLEAKARRVKFTKEAREKFNSELKKLKNMPQLSAEATVVRNYLEWLLEIPWNHKTKVKHNLLTARKILDQDHYGLDTVKDRILEFLAVQNRVGKIKGSILCFVGPPGVGKTSLAKSIAAATGRKFVRISLGGISDESEIRGHRRTYIGSMPGKIISGMKKAKVSDPLFLLDEIDKLGSDWKGDPASALLEVLDPEQNTKFNDHYLEVDYDLSDVMFITTANSYKMPTPLLDRLEIIKLSGYTEFEKLEIAKKHLVAKQKAENGLNGDELSVSDDALMRLVRDYTREAGVRNLEREISKLCRKVVKKITENPKEGKIEINLDNLEQFAGIAKFKRSETEDQNLVGIVNGLAWTEVGGEILSIEAISLPGKGKTTLTGKLGDVMQESIQAAISFVRSKSKDFGIDPSAFEKTDFHIHVPEGATPKDGPSAGIAMMTSIVSTLTGIPIKKDVAMTGEITLRGRVLPIGGLKEKILAAHRGGIKTVIIPKANEADLFEIPDSVKKDLNIISVELADEVLPFALLESSFCRNDFINNHKILAQDEVSHTC